jgi:hypothetical protein
MGAGGEEPVEGGRMRQKRSIGGPLFTLSPAIEDAQDNGFGLAHIGLRFVASF